MEGWMIGLAIIAVLAVVGYVVSRSGKKKSVEEDYRYPPRRAPDIPTHTAVEGTANVTAIPSAAPIAAGPTIDTLYVNGQEVAPGLTLPELAAPRRSKHELKFRLIASPLPDLTARAYLKKMVGLAGQNAALAGTAELYLTVVKVTTGYVTIGGVRRKVGLPADVGRFGSDQAKLLPAGLKFTVTKGECEVEPINQMQSDQSMAIYFGFYGDEEAEVEVTVPFEVKDVDDKYDEEIRGSYNSPLGGPRRYFHLPLNVT